MSVFLARVGLLLGLTTIHFLGLADPATTAEVERFFPVGPNGEPPAVPESGWRIHYEIVNPKPPRTCFSEPNYGCGTVLELQSVEFMRGRKPSGEPDWVRVLNKLALAEMLVIYNNDRTFSDIGNFPSSLAQPASADMTAPNAISREVRDDGIVIEIVDDHVRWAPKGQPVQEPAGPTDRVGSYQWASARRGQAVELWAMLFADFYTYIIRYGFADDGTIHVRVGATGQNGFSDPVGTQRAIHVHMPVWRLEFDLGSAASNSVEVVERRHRQDHPVSFETVTQKFNAGVEGGEVWSSEAFTTLMITNSRLQDGHKPVPHSGYKLLSMRQGSLRTPLFPQTRWDFWVLRTTPSDPSRRLQGPELRYLDIMEYLARPEPIDGHPVAIWHSVPFQHIPRTEDFGREGYMSENGLTLTMWSGFDLIPHNLWGKTPFYEP
jgi:copper amine oxidase-like protein